MANVSFYQQADMNNPYIWYGYVYDYSSSHISLSNYPYSATYYGSFTYSSTGLSGGTVTGYKQWYYGNLSHEVSGASISAITLNNYLNSGDAAAVQSYVLSGNDYISGSAYSDYLKGYAGNDVIDGNEGSDILDGGAGADRLDGGLGTDTLYGGTGNDTYVVNHAGDEIIETSTLATEIDTVTASLSWTLGGNLERLTLTGSNHIDGTGNTLNNTITGNAGNNTLTGNDGIDTLTGNEGNDSLDGGVANDVMTGGSGDDTLNGGTGNDNMNGGAGSDYYYVDSSLDVVTESLTALQGGGVDTVESTVTRTLGLNFDRLILTGLLNINGTGNALDNELTGNGGNNSLTGGLGADILNGGAGNDSLDGGVGVDSLTGDIGDDTYLVDNIGDIVTESSDEGTDLVKVNIATANGTFALGDNVENATLINTVAYNLTGNNENNILTGNAVANVIDAGLGNDTLNGGLGNDTMRGGGGDDTYFVNVATDTVIELGGEGTDTVKSAVTYSLIDTDGVAGSNGGNVENLTLTGASAINATGNTLNNVLTGNTAANILQGLDGDDALNGGAGNDVLIGGIGADMLTGGIGADRFDFNLIAESLVGASRDLIADFSRVQLDKIDLSTIDAKTDTLANDAFTFIGNNVAFSNNVAGQLRFDITTSILSGDIDGNGGADFEIQLTGVTTNLLATDFIL